MWINPDNVDNKETDKLKVILTETPFIQYFILIIRVVALRVCSQVKNR